MKNSLIYTTAIIFLLFVTACDDRFEEVNTNPNGISDVDPSHLFANAARASFRSGITAYDYQIAGQMAHFYVGVFVERFIDQYQQDLSGGSYESVYNTVYKSQLRYYNEILMLTGEGAEKENPFQYAVADVMAVLAYAKITDAYGDIPYFNGGFGNFGELSPDYDSQRDIYLDLISRLTNDIQTLKQSTGTVGMPGQDPIFNDEPDLWIRFANSLKLRLAMRIRHVEPSVAATAISESLNDPLMTLNAHNVMMENLDGDNSQLFSPWYNTFSYYNFRISDRVVGKLTETSDPRLPIYVAPISDGGYKGFVNGLVESAFSEAIKEEHSFPAEYLVGKAAPSYLMTAAEITFLKAEAALFNLWSGDADVLYKRGIELAMERVGVEEEDINTFLATETASLTGTQEEQFEQICEQMWLAFAPNLPEAYAMMRRTGYPSIPQRNGVVTDKGDTDGELPSRLIYPLSEKLKNSENVNKAIANLNGGDELKSRVWWDVRR